MLALATDAARDTHARATGQVLRDLIDAIIADGLLTVTPAPSADGEPDGGPDGQRWAEAGVGGGRSLRFRVRPAGFPRAWRLGRGPVLLAGDGEPRTLDAAGVVRALARAGWSAADLVCADLAAAADAVALAAEEAPHVAAAAVGAAGLTARTGEQLTALGDRPFHPLGRHKRGWSRADATRWGPHAAEPFGLAWWAVPRSWLARPAGPPATGGGTGGGATAPTAVLTAEDRERLAHAQRRTRTGDDHVVLPVHPWQACRLGGPPPGAVPLAGGLGRFRATASLRTLEPADRPGLHLKLPLAVAALGAGRQLPVRYLRNGDRAQRLLECVARHPALRGRVHVCDETAWWTTPGGAGGLGDGDLGCQLRRYPADLVDRPDRALVPLGAFGVTVGDRAPALDALGAPGSAAGGDGVLAALTGELVRLAVVSLAHGVMPELHGQNVVVAVRAEPTPVAGLVLRDHDAVRIHPPWLRAAGLPDPGYVVDGRTPNTLVADSPEALLGWFQMLGVHLGLFPVVRALRAGEAAGWRTVAAATRACLAELDEAASPGAVDLAPAVAVARRQLLEAPGWPVKLVLGPLLERGASCGTSMPSAVGTAANPLRPGP